MTVEGLPDPIAALVTELERVRGVVAVVLGGSRAEGTADGSSDWDLGVYYRGELDLDALGLLGEIHPPGSWGRIMNGGAWLLRDGIRVDVLLRDLDVVDHWTECATRGEFEVDALLGYVAGVPTYSLAAERAVAKLLSGALADPIEFPPRLASTAVERWRFSSQFTLQHARARAARGDVVGTSGQLAKAIIEEAHARLCRRRAWVLNEKRIVARAGLEALEPLFAQRPSSLSEWVERVAATLA